MRTHKHTHTQTHTSRTQTHARTRTHTARAHTHARTHKNTPRTQTHAHKHTHAYAQIHTHPKISRILLILWGVQSADNIGHTNIKTVHLETNKRSESQCKSNVTYFSWRRYSLLYLRYCLFLSVLWLRYMLSCTAGASEMLSEDYSLRILRPCVRISQRVMDLYLPLPSLSCRLYVKVLLWTLHYPKCPIKYLHKVLIFWNIAPCRPANTCR